MEIKSVPNRNNKKAFNNYLKYLDNLKPTKQQSINHRLVEGSKIKD